MLRIMGFTLTVALASAASAQDMQSRFDRLDENRDGEVSWSEAYSVRTSEFLEMDEDMDGLVVESELQGRARGFDAFDLDGDGEVQLAEYLESHRSMFTKFDQDESDSINLQEFEQAQAAAQGG